MVKIGTAALTMISLILMMNPACARLQASVNQHEVELGKSLTLTLRSDQQLPKLNTVVMQKLEQTFRLEPLNNESSDSNALQQRQWRLYPLQTGALTIPALYLGSAQSEPLAIHVEPPVDPRSATHMSVNFETPADKIWLRETVYVRVQLKSQSPIVVLKTPDFEQDGLIVTRLESRRESLDNDTLSYQHTTGWMIQPRRHGDFTLKLPAIEFVRDGITSHRFYVPPLSLQVQPLPAYLPPGIPVGRLELYSELNANWLFTGTLSNLKLRISAENIPAVDLPDLQHQFSGTADLAIYPARKQTQSVTSAGNLVSESLYEIPFKVQSGGIRQLPKLRVDYFDSKQGRIETRILPGRTLYTMPRSLFYLTVALLALGLWWPAKRYLPVLYYQGRRYSGYMRTVFRLRQVHNTRQLRQLLQRHADSEGWPANLTLRQWSRYWYKTYGYSPLLEQTLKELEQHCYFVQPAAISTIRTCLLRVLLQHRPLLARIGLLPVREAH